MKQVHPFNSNHFRNLRAPFALAACLLSVFVLSSCSMIVSSATSDMMTHLSSTITNNDDLDLVESGAPAYLLMIDSLVSKDPDNEKMLTTAATLYASYADLFVKDPARARKMADKALGYATRAVCLSDKRACNLTSSDFETFEVSISRLNKNHLAPLFALGNAWAKWILVNKSDFNAIADIARIEVIMEQVIRLDETYKDGAAYLYMGTLSSLLPPALGGKPEKAKAFFENALDISSDKNLMARVLYAKFYARMMFDRDLHDRLLNEVLDAEPDIPGYTLVNTWAKKQAADLMVSADDYF